MRRDVAREALAVEDDIHHAPSRAEPGEHVIDRDRAALGALDGGRHDSTLIFGQFLAELHVEAGEKLRRLGIRELLQQFAEQA